MKITIGTGMAVLGVAVFVIAGLTLVSRHPVTLFIMGLGVAIYLLGKKLNQVKQ